MKHRRLTMRKWEIVAHLYHDGLTYEEIATRLGISPRTVTKHIEQIALRYPGEQPPAWKVLRAASTLLEMGYGEV
jgi:DNA-directed RNA polymerase specialized sigma24 family protein